MSEKKLTITWSEEDIKETSLEDKNDLIRALANRYVFVIHAFLYFSVSGFLIMLWAINVAHFWTVLDFWPMHTLFGWGIAIGIHTLTYIMYNGLNTTLTKISQKSGFSILFVYHLFLYIFINIYLLILNLLYTPELLWIIWPLTLWGIAIGLHALGFLTWDKSYKKNLSNLREKYKDLREDYPEKKLEKMARKKITHFWILLIHIMYFAVVNILAYATGILEGTVGVAEQVSSTLSWGSLLGIHIFAFVLVYYPKLKPVVKGLIFNIVCFVVFFIMNLVAVAQGQIPINWILYSIILWGIIIGIHIIIAKKWDSYKAKSFEKISTISTTEGFDLDSFEIESRATSLLVWRWSFVAHLLVYAVGLILIYVELGNAGIDTAVLIHPAMGWLIAVAVHGAIYLCIELQILDFFPITAMIHLAVYIVVCIYISLLSPVIGIVVMGGWGIGIGLHVLLAFLTRRP